MEVFGLGIGEMGILAFVSIGALLPYIAALAASIALCLGAKRQACPNGYAIASLICGIASLIRVGAMMVPLSIAFAIAAIVLSRRPAEQSRGFATAGLVLGIAGLALNAITFLFIGASFFFVASAC